MFLTIRVQLGLVSRFSRHNVIAQPHQTQTISRAYCAACSKGYVVLSQILCLARGSGRRPPLQAKAFRVRVTLGLRPPIGSSKLSPQQLTYETAHDTFDLSPYGSGLYICLRPGGGMVDD